MKKIFYPLAIVLLLASCGKEDNGKLTNTDQVSQAEDKSTNKDEQKEENSAEGSTDQGQALEKLDKTYYDYFDTVTTYLTYSDDKEGFEKACDLLEKI